MAGWNGNFQAVGNNGYAGNIVYALRLRNASAGACTVTGIPHVQLLNAKAAKLPTAAVAAHPGVKGAIVTLAPNKAAVSTARFSPDVPGKGEQQLGHCEAISYKLRVTPSAGGGLIAPITPATSVCEHGGMAFSVLTALGYLLHSLDGVAGEPFAPDLWKMTQDDLEAIGRPMTIIGADTMQGVPLSAGVAEGPALVLHEPVEVKGEEPYILVCPSTDPAWVPLFVQAKGLVMETGGVLSHGAIVAREFGLPAVAGLPDVHRRIQTGQRLRIDGSTGSVAVLP